ncbi:MAG: hypothetical protein K8L99_27535 [Anaerolineae bacterium]|nr:hypothetical protein [Anaerolineae bacterium]
MAVSISKARDYVYGHGTLFERALYSYLFEDGSLERVHQCLLCYKNPDHGWAHRLEHDAACPDSHPLALEFLLRIHNDTGLPVKAVLDGTPQWLEAMREEDGSLKNPSTIRDYPLAPWWQDSGGQTQPDSIVGNLTALGLVTPSLAESTRKWVQANVTLESIHENAWLFMMYHQIDYFLHVQDFPDAESYRVATIGNITACAQDMPEKQYYVLLQFAPKPDSVLAIELPNHLIERSLDYLMEAQQEDGHWNDEHNLPQWFPYTTITVLNALKNYGRL